MPLLGIDIRRFPTLGIDIRRFGIKFPNAEDLQKDSRIGIESKTRLRRNPEPENKWKEGTILPKKNHCSPIIKALLTIADENGNIFGRLWDS